MNSLDRATSQVSFHYSCSFQSMTGFKIRSISSRQSWGSLTGICSLSGCVFCEDRSRRLCNNFCSKTTFEIFLQTSSQEGSSCIVIKNGTGARCSSLEHLKTYSMRTWTHWMKSVQHTLLRASVATSGKRTFFFVFLFIASHFSTPTPQLLLVGGQKKWLSTI